ncbi:MAG TPA: HEAT repeat domain-containing protein [Polyangiaceae bacterium]|jgi:HEAT repeat protein
MLESNHLNASEPPPDRLPPPPLVPRIPMKRAAKWPPDDDAPAGGRGMGSFGGGGMDDGNFKKGNAKPAFILGALVLVLGGAAALFFGVKNSDETMSVTDQAKERKSIELLPKAEQLPKWRTWAARSDTALLQQEAFAQLAWVKDPEGMNVIITKGLGSEDHRMRGTAAQALLEYGAAAEPAKPALLKSLAEADNSDKPQVCWALANIKAGEAFDTVMSEYRQGHLAEIQKIDGAPAFDPEVLSSMVPIEKIAAMAGDESESVRQLVATDLSRTGDARWTDTLIKLVSDKSIEVAREAAVGLGRIANEKALGPLVDALGKADKDSRSKFLEALRDGVGAKGLVLALKSVSHESAEREKFQTKQIFDMLHDLEDPRGGDALAQYIASNPKAHWKTEAAFRLAEVGDLRAAPTLGWRMTQDPMKLYNDVDDPELRRDDNERVVAARMLADLAILHPEALPQLLAAAEDSVMDWITSKPQPHANGLRFLVAAGSKAVVPKLLAWSDPKAKFPQPGAQPPMPMAWETAQSALRYLGWTKEPRGWPIFEKQLNRQGNKKYDVTMEGLQQGGLAVLGMTIRALGSGVADGYAQWGDPRAYPILVKYIEDKENNEQSRGEACFALSWVATDDEMKDVVKKVHDFNKPDPKDALIRSCYLESLIHRPVPDATAGLIDLLKGDVDLAVRHQAARAIAFGGITRNMIPQIFDKLKDNELRTDAALALLIGSDADTAGRALASFEDAPPEAMEELKSAYNQTFGYWSDKNYENGDVARWVENALGVKHVRVKEGLQEWPKLILSRALQGIEFDNGPHSITKVQFRYRLIQDAKGNNEIKRQAAIEILKFMKEKGVLMALRNEAGETGALAKQAFFEVMNPKVAADKIPDAVKAENGNAGGSAH